jgi:hypothetical protein
MDCPICFEAINPPATGITTMSCNHSFHYKCLSTWFINQPDELQSCPCCRREAGPLERQPFETEIKRDEDTETLAASELDDSETERLTPIPPSPPPSNSTITVTWFRQPNGVWRRQVIERPVDVTEEPPLPPVPFSRPDADAVINTSRLTLLCETALQQPPLLRRSNAVRYESS